MHRRFRKKPYTVINYLAELSIDDGLHLISEESIMNPLYVFGERVKRDYKRFAVLRAHSLQCCFCGLKATRFLVSRHKNDHVMPYSINAYAGEVMLTWDHILPKSHGGSDHVDNGRVACGPCNMRRGNKLTIEDVLWAVKQDPKVIFKNVAKNHRPKQPTIKNIISSNRELMNNLAQRHGYNSIHQTS